MSLNHPQTVSPPQSMEKLSSMKLIPDAKKFGDHWPKILQLSSLLEGMSGAVQGKSGRHSAAMEPSNMPDIEQETSHSLPQVGLPTELLPVK